MSRFPTTRWSMVLGAGSTDSTARASLEKLCRTYRSPVLAYVRRLVRDVDLAEDYTQAFFARLIENDTTTVADPARGRFRTWLLVAVQRFVGHEVERAHAAKRGGGSGHVDLDDPVAVAGAVAPGPSPEQAFDRDWALALVQAALARLRDEAAAAGKLALFERLREFVVERPDDADYAAVADALGMRRNTVAVAIHRLRARLRELVRDEIAETVADADALDAELAALRSVLGPAP
jgi:RNA polymerase sigma-70 factor (ECF subfamily)